MTRTTKSSIAISPICSSDGKSSLGRSKLNPSNLINLSQCSLTFLERNLPELSSSHLRRSSIWFDSSVLNSYVMFCYTGVSVSSERFERSVNSCAFHTRQKLRHFRANSRIFNTTTGYNPPQKKHKTKKTNKKKTPVCLAYTN